jgi:putative aldouronate transport system substrate-binding protein
MPDDAQWRLDIFKDTYLADVHNQFNYPRVFLSLEQADRIAQIEADLMPFVSRKRAEWIANGKVAEEWDAYLEELNRLGLEEWMQIKQEAYDTYLSNNK